MIQNKDYDVVEMDQWEKGHELEAPYVVKVTVNLQDNLHHGESLGLDTITFGVAPRNQNREAAPAE